MNQGAGHEGADLPQPRVEPGGGAAIIRIAGGAGAFEAVRAAGDPDLEGSGIE